MPQTSNAPTHASILYCLFAGFPSDWSRALDKSGHNDQLPSMKNSIPKRFSFPVITFSIGLLLLAFCGLASAADDKSDPVGTWKCEYEIGGQPRTSTLTIKKDGDKLAGTMDWPDQKDAKLKDVKLKDGELTFSAERVVGGNTFNVEYKLKVDGDKLKGKGAVVTGDEKREFDFEGKREKKDK
jgi:hypothetical protein